MTKPTTAIERLKTACKFSHDNNAWLLPADRQTAVKVADVETMLTALVDLAAILSAWSPYTSVDAERRAAMVAILDRMTEVQE